VGGDARRGEPLAQSCDDVHARLARIIAVALIVLGTSPFTAPFATFDLSTLSDQNHQGRPSADHTPHGALVKTVADPDKAPVLAATAALTTPLFSVIANETAVRIARLSSTPVYLQSLRI
jgi:hypothetical protein